MSVARLCSLPTSSWNMVTTNLHHRYGYPNGPESISRPRLQSAQLLRWVPPFRRFTFIPRHALLDPLLAPLRIAISKVVISDTELKAAAPTDFV
jgi:hypothetical protein